MQCSFDDIRRKEVIDITDGERLGYIDDVRVDLSDSSVTALVIYGRPRLFGILGRDADIIIPCSSIRVVGGEVILIKRTAAGSLSESTNTNGIVIKKSSQRSAENY